MQKLHLVGVTTDRQGLILSARRGSRSGGYSLVVDEALADLVEELRSEEADEDDAAAVALTDRVESRLPVREVQARLRRGRSIEEVAKQAGVDPTWVERFAAPVYAERAQVVSRVRSTPLRRPRLGPSGLGIGAAVSANLVERGVGLTPGEIDDSWSAHQVGEGRWAVRFAFRYRGRDQVLRFDLDEASGEITAADRLSAQFGFVEPDARARAAAAKLPPAPVRAPEPRPTAKRATVATGFRADASTKAVSRPAKERERAASAMSKAAARGAVEADRAARRKAKEKREHAARLERERLAAERAAAAEARRRAREATAQAKADKARAQAKKAAAAKKAASKKAASKKAASKKAASKKAGAKRAGTKKAATKKQAATRAGTRSSGARGTAKRAASRSGSRRTTTARTPVRAAPNATGRTTRGAGAPTSAQRGTGPRPSSPPRSATSSARSPDARRTERARIGSAPIRPSSPTERRDDERTTMTSPPGATGGRPPAALAAAGGDGAPGGRSLADSADRWEGSGSGGPRVQFRSGLVEQASAGGADGADRSGERVRRPDTSGPANGTTPVRPAPAGRPRRTRPLRAT